MLRTLSKNPHGASFQMTRQSAHIFIYFVFSGYIGAPMG